MTAVNLVGCYSIQGTNQEESKSTYKGTLQLSLDENGRIIALWQIGADQTQQGIGFFKDHILVINFNYQNEENQIFRGTVVYKCLTKDILEGFWSEEYGDPQFLGTETAYRDLKNQSMLN